MKSNFCENQKTLMAALICATFLSGGVSAYAAGNPTTIQAVQQNSQVKGTVVDATGEPVIGASVVVKGTTNGTITDFDGNFVLTCSKGATLEISYIGYVTQSVKIGGGNVKVVLKEDAKALDEVVVVGYGVQKKSDVTGAMARVGAKELMSKPVSNAFEALQGKAAGVDITSSSRPGTVGDIRIRGNRSLNATNAPLYVVDGVPLNSGGIETLNPHDIESIDILKDASSTAIYGSRGANGVILITTKRGKAGAFSMNYAGSVTLETLKDKSPAMSASDYITWRRWAYYNSNTSKYTAGDQPTYEQDQSFFSGDAAALANVNKGWNADHTAWDGSKVSDTDWAGMVTRTGITHEHTLSGSGGSDKLQGSFSFGYLDNKGTQKGQEYERFNIATTVDLQATDWMKLGASVNASYGVQNYGYSRTGQSSSSGPTEIYAAAKAIPRYAVPYDEDGDLITNPAGSTTNAYTVVDEWTKSTDERQTYRALASFYALMDFGKIWKPLEGLNYKFAFGPDFRYFRKGIFISEDSAVRAGSSNYSSWGSERHFSWTLDNMITYNKTIDKHHFDVTLLQSASKYNKETAGMSEKYVPVSEFMWNNMGAIDITDTKYAASMSTGLTESQLASYMARVNYSFMDRYLLTVSGRYDGSSVLAKGNKWDFFPSAALGWRIDQENFLKDVSWISQLKLRLGMGTTGNAAVDPYGTLGTVGGYWMPFSGGNQLVFTTNEPYYVDMSKNANLLANKSLTWEKTTQYNFGVDFSFLNGRISGSMDLYTSVTKDLLMRMTLPSLSGYPAMMANVGETRNKGVDLTLSLIPVQTKDFAWNSTLNVAYQKDKIEELSNGKQDDLTNNWFIGESINVYYGYQANGLWQESDAEEMAKYNANGHKFSAGMVRPVDQPDENGEIDYKIDENDRVILGSKNPRWTLGWSNTFTYKGLELSVEVFGRFNYMVNTGGEGQLGMFNQREISYWTPSNTGADWQKPIYSQAGGDPYSSLLGFKKASFLKLRNISLGYNFDKKICRAIGIQNLKVYAQAKNLGDIYSSVDFMDLDLGTTYYNRGFTFGLQVGF